VLIKVKGAAKSTDLKENTSTNTNDDDFNRSISLSFLWVNIPFTLDSDADPDGMAWIHRSGFINEVYTNAIARISYSNNL
jgi:hypothetical protein